MEEGRCWKCDKLTTVINLKRICENCFDDMKDGIYIKEAWNKFAEFVYKRKQQFKQGLMTINENFLIVGKDGNIFIKVIDYRKGYWAETPVSITELFALTQAISEELQEKFNKLKELQKNKT